MKDLILITAYCPDIKRENILRRLVYSLQSYRNTFDICIVSHSIIPEDIQRGVDIFLFDKKNEILTEWDLLNQPWFNPGDQRRIQSSFLTRKNTHLAVWRLMILGFSLAKNAGYSKLHHIEYDCEINSESEFIENSQILEEYDSVVYIDKQDTVDDILFGSFQSYLLSSLNPFLLNLDEKEIKNMIRNSLSKSPEQMLLNILREKKCYVKDRKKLEENNKFGIFDGQSESMLPWAVPFYDKLENTVGFIVWNTRKEPLATHQIILNEEKFFKISTPFQRWSMHYFCHIEELKSLMIIEDGKIRDTFFINSEKDKEIFKKMSYRHEK